MYTYQSSYGNFLLPHLHLGGRVQVKRDGTRGRKGGELKGKLGNEVGTEYAEATSEHNVYSITTAETHTSADSSRLN